MYELVLPCHSNCFFQNQRHIHLAWGQIGISEANPTEIDPAASSPLLQHIMYELRSKSTSGASSSPCFPVQGEMGTSVCLFTTANVTTSTQPSFELGVLLQNSLANFDPWQKFLRKLQVPGAEVVSLESQDASRSNGGSAAGNLLWLIQSLGRTYSRTRELIKVCPIPSVDLC